MSDIGKDLEASFNDVVNSFEQIFEGAGLLLTEGVKNFFSYKLLSKKKRKIKMVLTLSFALALFFMYVNISSITDLYSVYLIKYDKSYLNAFLYKEVVTKALMVILVLIVLMITGYPRYYLIKDLDYQFRSIGFIYRSKRTVKVEGKKVNVNKTPRLIDYSKSEDGYVYIFSLRGMGFDRFKQFEGKLEDVFGMNIFKMDRTRSKKAIRIVCVDDLKRDELMENEDKIKVYDNQFEKVGLCGKGVRERRVFGEDVKEKNYPMFVKEENETINNKSVMTTTFKSTGTELEDWKASKYKMENVFNYLVHEIKQTKNDKQLFEIVTLDLKDDLKDMYPWDDKIISEEDGVLILGEGLLDKIRLDLNQTPHALAGGVTGSGKSVLINCMAWQGIKKGYYIIPVDFKGGLELGMFESFNDVISEEKEVLISLKKLKKEHEERLKLFKEHNVKNIVEYNLKVEEKDSLARILLIIDEIAELLDKTGKNKEQKDLIEAIEAELNTLARLSRATGINIITGTQRPDSNVIKGQIKNNLGARICGRMTDKEPSIMVLGSPDAMRIPDIKGRYLFSTGADPISLQAYWFKEEYVKPGNYRKGRLLTIDENDRKTNVNKKASSIKLEKEAEEIDDVDAEFERLKKEDPEELARRSAVIKKTFDTFDSENEKTKFKKPDPLEAEEDQEPIEEIIEVHNEEDEEVEYEVYDDDLYNGDDFEEEELEAEELEEVEEVV